MAGINLHLPLNERGQYLALFTLAGAMIMPTTEWSLGTCLRKIHKSDARLGVGYVSEVSA